MGKFANQSAYREFERQQNRKQDAYFEPDAEPTDEDLASQHDDDYWRRLDAGARRHVWGEMGRMG
jgi:hypothetical protein